MFQFNMGRSQPLPWLAIFLMHCKIKLFFANLRFWSESSISILSFWTQSWMLAAWLGIPDEMLINTAITVFIHSYNKLIADVLWINVIRLVQCLKHHSINGKKISTYLCIKLVNGSINFLPSLGSKGVRAPNYK